MAKYIFWDKVGQQYPGNCGTDAILTQGYDVHSHKRLTLTNLQPNVRCSGGKEFHMWERDDIALYESLFISEILKMTSI